jgi:hypothetical protein
MIARFGGRDLGLRRHVSRHRQARRQNGETAQQTGKETQALHAANFGCLRRRRKSRFGNAGWGCQAFAIFYFEFSGKTGWLTRAVAALGPAVVHENGAEDRPAYLEGLIHRQVDAPSLRRLKLAPSTSVLV